MTVFTVPTQPNLPWYRFRIALSGIIFTLRMRYNSRMQRWILDIADSSNNDLICGLPVLIQRDISGQYVVTGLPSGFLFATDNSQSGSQPTLDSFTVDHSLFYGDPTQ